MPWRFLIRPVFSGPKVIVAGLITTDTESPVARILDAVLAAKIPFLISTPLLGEYRWVLLHRRIRKLHKLTEDEIDRILLVIAENAIVREPVEPVNSSVRHP